MKIFLAGATGVIGRTLTPMLSKAGHDVVGTTTDPAKKDLLLALGARPVVLDVLDRQAVFTAFRSEPFQAVMDELTSLQLRNYEANNRLRIEGTRNLVDAARAAGVPRIVAQSFCLYAPADGLAHEDDPLDLNSGVYNRTIQGVLALEKAVAEFPESVILRYGMLYGPGTWFAADGLIANQIRRGEFIATNDISSFLHIEDAAQAALIALTGPQGTFNIADDEPARAIEWAPVFAAAIGAPTPPIQTDTPSQFRGVSNSKARRELQWQPLYPSWRKGFWQVLGENAPSGSAARSRP